MSVCKIWPNQILPHVKRARCRPVANKWLPWAYWSGSLYAMKMFVRYVPLLLALFLASSMLGAVPPIHVLVSDASGKVVFKGTTNASGAFATGKLQPANYVVQFTSTNLAMKGHHYGLVVSAGKARVSANAVPGEKFIAAGGIAMKITAGEPMAETLKKNPGLNNPAAIRAMERMAKEDAVNITGQVTAGR